MKPTKRMTKKVSTRSPEADREDVYVLAHPEDALDVFEHDAIWVDGTAMIVRDSLEVPRGTFRIVRELPVPRVSADGADGAEAAIDRARGWIDLEDLRRRIVRFAEAEARTAGLTGARADVRIDAPDDRGARRMSVEILDVHDAPDRAPGRSPEDN